VLSFKFLSEETGAFSIVKGFAHAASIQHLFWSREQRARGQSQTSAKK